jgi:hypothetical protein
MVWQTLSSYIPFTTGLIISNNILGSQRKAFFILFDKVERDSYYTYEIKNCYGLFIHNRIDPKKFY